MISRTLFYLILLSTFSTLALARGVFHTQVEPAPKGGTLSQPYLTAQSTVLSTESQNPSPSRSRGLSDGSAFETDTPLPAANPTFVNYDSRFGNHEAYLPSQGATIADVFVLAAASEPASTLVQLFSAHRNFRPSAQYPNFDWRDAHGRNAIFYASFASIIPDLIRYGANINAQDHDGRTALMQFVIFEGNALSTPISSNDALMRAVGQQENWRRIITSLLLGIPESTTQSADMNLEDNAGNTALHFAHNLEVAHLLITYGAHPELHNHAGQTPADLADARGDEVLALYLRSQERAEVTTTPVVEITAPMLEEPSVAETTPSRRLPPLLMGGNSE